MSRESISLYQNNILMIWFLRFTPIVVIAGVGIKIIFELTKISNKINPSWLYYGIIISFTLGIITITTSLLIRFLKKLIERDANVLGSEHEE